MPAYLKPQVFVDRKGIKAVMQIGGVGVLHEVCSPPVGTLYEEYILSFEETGYGTHFCFRIVFFRNKTDKRLKETILDTVPDVHFFVRA
jgi:hypothetical protein